MRVSEVMTSEILCYLNLIDARLNDKVSLIYLMDNVGIICRLSFDGREVEAKRADL